MRNSVLGWLNTSSCYLSIYPFTLSFTYSIYKNHLPKVLNICLFLCKNTVGFRQKKKKNPTGPCVLQEPVSPSQISCSKVTSRSKVTSFFKVLPPGQKEIWGCTFSYLRVSLQFIIQSGRHLRAKVVLLVTHGQQI